MFFLFNIKFKFFGPLPNTFYQKNNEEHEYTVEDQAHHKHTECGADNKHDLETFGAKMSQVDREGLE
jgi:hypothetical protein